MLRRDKVLERLIRRDEPMSRHTTFGIGGPAQYFAEAWNEADLVGLVRWAKEGGLASRVIGGGANLLVADSGLRGLVIENRLAYCRINERQGLMIAGSGALLADITAYACAAGWSGLEWAIGVPGTVGGAVVGNAGAFGGYMSGVVTSVTVADASGERRTLTAEECGFVYRGSRFKGSRASGLTILNAGLALRPGDRPGIAAKVADYVSRREAAQPWMPSAGSVFKRTADHPAGWLVEQVGLKGKRIGGAQISPQHANFIINTGGATADDVRRLIEAAREAVKRLFGLDLELEIELVS